MYSEELEGSERELNRSPTTILAIPKVRRKQLRIDLLCLLVITRPQRQTSLESIRHIRAIQTKEQLSF